MTRGSIYLVIEIDERKREREKNVTFRRMITYTRALIIDFVIIQTRYN